MTSLILDTSTDLCLIALAQKGEIIAEEIFLHHNNLSGSLLPSIQAAMQKHALQPSHLTALAVGIGPGSYTGTRLCAAVAKSLAFALQIPITPFSSPLAFLPTRLGAFAFLLPTKAGPYFLLKGTLARQGVHQDCAKLIPEHCIAQETQGVDFFICPNSAPPPLHTNNCVVVPPSPNLPLLLRFLSTFPPLPPESIQLHYLHTPFHTAASSQHGCKEGQ